MPTKYPYPDPNRFRPRYLTNGQDTGEKQGYLQMMKKNKQKQHKTRHKTWNYVIRNLS